MNTISFSNEDLERVNNLLDKKDYHGSLKILQEALTKELANPVIYRLIARSLIGLSKVSESLPVLLNAYQIAPKDRENVLDIVFLAIEINAVSFGIRILRDYCCHNQSDLSALEQLNNLQFRYIETLENGLDLSRTIDNLHTLLKSYLRGRKINIDTLEWEIMGGLAIDAAMFPKIKAAGYLNEKDPIFLCGDSANPPIVNLISRVVPVVNIPELGRHQFLRYEVENSEYFLKSEEVKEKLFGKEYRNKFDDCFEFYHSTNGRSYYPSEEASQIISRSETVSFSDEEVNYAKSFLNEKFGMSEFAEWVCIYARDPGYYGETEKDSKFFRNAPLKTFFPTIDRIIESGLHVIRVGSATNIPIEYSNPKLIDYAFKCQDQLVDLYLIAKSKLLIGSPGGLTHLAFTFNTKVLNVHTINLFPSWGELYIPKKPVDASTDKLLSLEEFFSRTYRNPEFFQLWEDGILQESKLGVKYIHNSADEILDAYEELLLRQANKYQESDQEKELKAIFEKLTRELPGPFRIETPISTRFLQRNTYLFD